MENETLVIFGLFEKAVSHAFQTRVGSVQVGVHLQSGLLLEYVLAVQFPVLQVSDYEPGHVGRCGAERSRREGQLKFETTLEILVAIVVACGHVGSQVFRQRLAKGATCHVQRHENVLFDVLVERQTRNALDNLSCQSSTIVGIGGYFTRWENACRQVGFQPITEWTHPFGLKPP